MKSTAATLSLLCGAAVADVDTTLGTNTLPTSVGTGTGNQAYRCGGKQKGFALAPQGAGQEHEDSNFGTSGLMIDVDTSSCSFGQTQMDADYVPNYVASVTGDMAHWQLVGMNSIHRADANSFRLYLWHPTLRGTYLEYYAQRYNWDVNWAAQTDSKSGITAKGAGGWKQDTRHTNQVYIDVDTTASGFTTTPSYVVSLHGTKNHGRAVGAHQIYDATATSFRLYLTQEDFGATDLSSPTAGSNADGVNPMNEGDHNISPASADADGWQVAYIGSDDAQATGSWAAYTAGENEEDAEGIYTDVVLPTSAVNEPIFITTVAGTGTQWPVHGGGAVYQPSKDGFRVVLSKATVAEAANWNVNYLTTPSKRNCQVSDWTDYSECSLSCNGGTQISTRKVLTMAAFGGTCVESENDGLLRDRACETQACPEDCVMGAWSGYSGCSVSCGVGVRVSDRTLVQPTAGGMPCGDATQEIACNLGECPVDCVASGWTYPEGDAIWSTCTKLCNTGVTTNTQTVTPGTAGISACPDTVTTKPCNENVCPEPCMGYHQADSECSVTCGTGTKTSTWVTLTAQIGNVAGDECPATMTTACEMGPCPVDCTYTALVGDISTCSKACGGGTYWKTRTITSAIGQSSVCPVTSQEFDCNMAPCAIDCEMTEWSGFGACTVGGAHATCKTGATKSQTREVATKAWGTGATPCPGGLTDVGDVETSTPVACDHLPECPVDCQQPDWTNIAWGTSTGWSDAANQCGSATQTRDRTASTVQPLHGGLECEATTETRHIQVACPLPDCEYNVLSTGVQWTEWSYCSQSCGSGGTQTQTRRLNRGTPADCGITQQSRACNVGACPQDCLQSDWGDWTACSKSCLTGDMRGEQTRSRTLTTAAQDGGIACGASDNLRECNLHPCPVDCVANGWIEDGTCSEPCGDGQQKWTRTLATTPAYGGADVSGGVSCGTLDKETACNLQSCAVHCDMSQWTDWGTCSLSCWSGTGSTGKSSRTRSMITAPNSHVDAVGCPTDTYAERDCNVHRCPIDCAYPDFTASDWGSCSKSCTLGWPSGQHEAGTRSRSRTLVPPQFGGALCPDAHEHEPCNEAVICDECQYSDWSAYGACSLTCGDSSAVSQRFKTRTVAYQYGVGCGTPVTSMAEDCAIPECPVHCEMSEWTDWGACTKSCGPCSKTRTRSVVLVSDHSGIECPPTVDQVVCTNVPQYCPVDCVVTAWSPWGSRSGGQNQLVRQRDIVSQAEYAGKVCPPLSEYKSNTCSEKTEYGPWSECSKVCGSGHMYRHREQTICSGVSTLHYQTRFTEGRLCNTAPCADRKSETTVYNINIPMLHERDQLLSQAEAAKTTTRLSAFANFGPSNWAPDLKVAGKVSFKEETALGAQDSMVEISLTGLAGNYDWGIFDGDCYSPGSESRSLDTTCGVLGASTADESISRTCVETSALDMKGATGIIGRSLVIKGHSGDVIACSKIEGDFHLATAVHLECSDSPCQNGATCTDDAQGHVCACVAGFTGADCQHWVPCPANTVGTVPGTSGTGGTSGCDVDAGYAGDVIATTTAPFWTTTVTPVACPATAGTSAIENVVDTCTVAPGYRGSVTATDESPFYSTTVEAVDCPANSDGEVPTGCTEHAGFAGGVTATTTDPFYTHDITAVNCPVNTVGTCPGASGTGATSGCIVNAGFSGKVTATQSAPFWTSDVTAIACPANSVGTVPYSSGTQGTSGCTTNAGFSGKVTADQTGPDFYTHNIAQVVCPANSNGFVDSGCTVHSGFSGGVAATQVDPFYTQDITAIACPADSAGTVPGTSGTEGTSGCTVDAGFSGAVTATTTGSFYTTTIAQVVCPANSLGHVDTGCTVNPGFSGAVTATTTDPFYTHDITAIACPVNTVGNCPGASGTGATSGCIVNAGFSGKVTATQSTPFWTSDVTAVACPANTAGTAPGTSGTGGTSGCTTNAGFKGKVTATQVGPTFYSHDVTDVDECIGVVCGGASTCAHGFGTDKFTCTCSDGWEGGGDDTLCTDVDECTDQSVVCGGDSVCSHGTGTDQYTCTCADGWAAGGVNTVCSTVTCPANSDGFVHSGCTVHSGFSGGVEATLVDPFYTQDITAIACPTNSVGTVPGTEGTEGTSGCAVDAGFSGAVTATTTGSFYTHTIAQVVCPANTAGHVDTTCTVNAGYAGLVTPTTTAPFYTTTVADVNECTLGTDNCAADATCTNTVGSFTCACNTGFTGCGTECTDDNECNDGTHDCHSQATCANSPGTFSCSCNAGYTGSGTACADDDECDTGLGTHNCHADATCANIAGSFTCTCNTHYSGTGTTCADINECDTNNGGCGDATYFTCTNVVGAVPICADINECLTNNGGCGDATYYSCSNNVGTDATCADIDECATANGGCGDATFNTCANNVGTVATCTDINECATNNGGCGDATYYDCANVANAAPTCTDIDECATNNGGCGNYKTCNNVDGGDATCSDIDHCATANGGCGSGFTCDNVSGNAPTCTDVVDCTATTCANGGTCSEAGAGTGQTSCACATGWDGATCTMDAVDCTATTCANGGTCSEAGAGTGQTSCACATGWQGATCTDPTLAPTAAPTKAPTKKEVETSAL